MFYYQTFFETWHNQHSWYEHYKNSIKRLGHRACLHVSRLLNWGIFTGRSLKIRSLCYLKHTRFYHEHKASLIQLSSIASFNSFLIGWLWEYCFFRTVRWLAWCPRLDPNTPNTKIFSPKKSCSTIKLFLFFKYVLY